MKVGLPSVTEPHIAGSRDLEDLTRADREDRIDGHAPPDEPEVVVVGVHLQEAETLLATGCCAHINNLSGRGCWPVAGETMGPRASGRCWLADTGLDRLRGLPPQGQPGGI